MQKSSNLRKELFKKKPIPAWLLIFLLLFFVIAMTLIVATVNLSNENDRLREYKQESYLQNSTLYEVFTDAQKHVLQNIGSMSGLLILILTIGLGFGLSKGIAIVRVNSNTENNHYEKEHKIIRL